MARILKVEQIQARKKALVEESEIYRQTIMVEVQNLRLYGVGVRRKFSVFAALNPVLMMAAPLAGSLWRRRRAAKPGLFGKLIRGWQLYRRVAPLIAAVMAQRQFKQRMTATREERSSTGSL